MSQILLHLLWSSCWHLTSEVQLSLALISSPIPNVGMGLVVKLQAMKQLTTLVTFFSN